GRRRARHEVGEHAAIDGRHHRGAAVQDPVLAGEEQLPGRAQSRRAHAASTRRAPDPGAALNVRRTPGTSPSAAAIASASRAAHKTLTCGPASMVKKAGVPAERSARTRAIAATVAGFQ